MTEIYTSKFDGLSEDDKFKWAHNHPLWNEIKNFIESERVNILMQEKRKIVNCKKSQRSDG